MSVKPLQKLLPPLVCCALALPAATLERLSLNDMIGQSTAIVRGKVLSSYAAFSGPAIYTHYKIQVKENLKGTAGISVEIRFPGGVANGMRQTYSGVPQFQPGDDFVFFLWTGKSGVTQVMGLTQGLFAVAAGGAPDPVVTRTASSEVMLDRRTGKQVKDQTLTMHLSDLRAKIQASSGGAVH